MPLRSLSLIQEPCYCPLEHSKSKCGMAKQRYSLWQRLRFAWVDPLIRKGLKGETLTLEELYLPDDSHADEVYERFSVAWETALADRNTKGKDTTSRALLLGVLVRLFGRQYAWGGLFKLLWGALVIAGAFYFVRSLLLFVGPEDKAGPYDKPWTGWVLSAGFFCAAVLWGALTFQAHVYVQVDTNVRRCMLACLSRGVGTAVIAI